MNFTKLSITQIICLLVFVIVIIAIVIKVSSNAPRGEALGTALTPLIGTQNTDLSKAAKAIIDNYQETRLNATKWSGVYWGCTFLAAILSALAGLILKFESILKKMDFKKDISATLAVTAALLIIISTSGDFQRKWQANRIAAAELEQTGYYLLENTSATGNYFKIIGDILQKRNMAIVGNITEHPITETVNKSPQRSK